MAITQFTTPVPSRDDPSGLFTGRANLFVSELPNFVDEMNVEIVNINTRSDQVAEDTLTVVASKDAALAASNFKGAWSGLTGALNTPASVSHSGAVWLLLENLADVTLSEPSEVNSDWLILPGLYSVNGSAGLIATTVSGVVSLSIDKATADNLRGGVANKFLDSAAVYAASAPVVSSGSGSFAPNFGSGGGRNFYRTLTGNSTLANPTNQVAGQYGVVFIEQDGTGSRTLSFGANWLFFGGTPGISSDPGTIDCISYYVVETGVIIASLQRGAA